MKTQFKGTSGNWKYEEIESGAGLFHCIVKKESDSIVTYVMPDYDEFKANALLISKAPELLEMLQKCRKTFKEKYNLTVLELDNLIKQSTEL